MAKFQISLAGKWQDYSDEEDKILKRAYMAGFPNARFHLRGQKYQYSFTQMKQINKDTRKQRDIRPPHKWKPPRKPVVQEGPTTVIKVPPGGPGTTIHIPHPEDKTKMLAVNVPGTAKVGQAMLVPVPPLSQGVAVPPAMAEGDEKKNGWSRTGKVAAAAAGVAVVGGLGVAGGILGVHVAEHGVDATADAAGDAMVDAGEAIADVAGDAGDWIGDAAGDAGDFLADAADSAGDFIMDLF